MSRINYTRYVLYFTFQINTIPFNNIPFLPLSTPSVPSPLQKVVMLQNVSNSSARFQLTARPNYSQFTVMIEPKTQTGSISPGMYIKLIIFFRCDILDEPEETLVINVQRGRSVIVKLHGYRDPPLLKSK